MNWEVPKNLLEKLLVDFSIRRLKVMIENLNNMLISFG